MLVYCRIHILLICIFIVQAPEVVLSSAAYTKPNVWNHISDTLFLTEVFLQAIQDLGIPIVQTLSEADAEIARLAHRPNSTNPSRSFVFSNDTDFCIYDVDVISIDSTLSIVDAVDKSVISCRKFDRIKFLKFFKIGPEKSWLLHLMATLCGNDYVGKSAGSLEKIFNQVPKLPKGR